MIAIWTTMELTRSSSTTGVGGGDGGSIGGVTSFGSARLAGLAGADFRVACFRPYVSVTFVTFGISERPSISRRTEATVLSSTPTILAV